MRRGSTWGPPRLLPACSSSGAQRTPVRARAPAQVRDRQQIRRHALDDRDQLQVARLQLVAEEPVHVERVLDVRGVDAAQHVEFDSVALQQADQTLIGTAA